MPASDTHTHTLPSTTSLLVLAVQSLFSNLSGELRVSRVVKHKVGCWKSVIELKDAEIWHHLLSKRQGNKFPATNNPACLRQERVS